VADAQVAAFARDLAAQDEVGKPKEFIRKAPRVVTDPAIPYSVGPLIDVANVLEARAWFTVVSFTLSGACLAGVFGGSIAVNGFRLDLLFRADQTWLRSCVTPFAPRALVRLAKILGEHLDLC
jgi:hypothetical protein